MSTPEEEKFLREKQEYEDALAAYQEILGRAAQKLPIPSLMTANYGQASSGPARAASDPWISERFPNLATAARRVQAEEADFLALDDPFASHAQGNCSISQYTINKVYEYYALFETIYLLASDEAFRKEIVAQIEAFFTGSGIAHYMRANELQNRADQLMSLRPGWLDFLLSSDEMDRTLLRRQADIDAELEEIGRETAFHMAIAEGKIADYFQSIWSDLKQKYYDCGLLYAVSTVAVDGVFLAAEIYAGLAFLRFLRFGVKFASSSRSILIEILDGSGHKLGSKTHSIDALEAKYGTPQENHLGGYEPDRNRDIPDKPAQDVLEEKRRAEQAEERHDVRDDGSYRASNDPKGVRRAPDGEAMVQDKDDTWTRISETSNNTKGRFGEMMADDWAAKKDPPWIKVNGPNSDMNTPGHQGLDSVYKNPNPPPGYFVTDAKYGKAGLGTLKDGTKQMSPSWIRKRISTEFDPRLARSIEKSHEPGILRVDKNGDVEWESLKNRKWRAGDQ
ncbi:hypothetical protein GFB49_17580 [Epibacterium sp. SM1979]|uniref:Uncharacterized protein n=1 Tax=Tritonibacter litoralis TaxID=2662264 RepID=A0A843YM11_9RHOB|nr:hypothetical protein [Tritonibacter litoralis]MQQ10282.1 hypothetical protein [Tritonibacter litoralis]